MALAGVAEGEDERQSRERGRAEAGDRHGPFGGPGSETGPIIEPPFSSIVPYRSPFEGRDYPTHGSETRTKDSGSNL